MQRDSEIEERAALPSLQNAVEQRAFQQRMPAGRVSLRAEQFRAGGNGPEDVQAVAEADVVCGPEQRVPDEVLPQGEEIGLVRDAEALGQLRDEAVEPLGGMGRVLSVFRPRRM